jgi:radical SAM superfamily enzyme YgiQ (UPF0313 family)
LSVEALDRGFVLEADRIGISVPMHTAMRLGVGLVERLRALAPRTPIAFYGLYAAVGADRTVGELVDAAFVGEYEPLLSAWCNATDPEGGVRTGLGVGSFAVPDRDGLPGLDRYAHLQVGDEHRMVGYVEASHGCRHRCRHCPIPAVYDGIYRIVGLEPLQSDIDQLIDAGARHITFGDPDFLNGPAHSLRVIESAHERHPDLTFDVTVKVEHLLAHRDLLPRMAEANTLFVVSAFETTHDPSLERLDKGHTASELSEAVSIARAAGLEIHPSWMPFMPWTTPEQVVDIFRFLDRRDLMGVTDPVQLSIRLLVPDGSLMLDVMDAGEYNANELGYRWSFDDPRSERLQADLATIASRDADSGRDPVATLVEMWAAALDAAGEAVTEAQVPDGATVGRPRLTEPWFC